MAIFVLNWLEPRSVNSLKATTEEEAILLTWARPTDHKSSYGYIVTWVRSDGPINGTEHQKTHEEEYNVSSLVPGSLYNFSVITVTPDDTQSDPMDLYNCTSMSIKVWTIFMTCSINTKINNNNKNNNTNTTTTNNNNNNDNHIFYLYTFYLNSISGNSWLFYTFFFSF